jgi:hypothetical protein
MAAAEIARECCTRREVSRPVDATNSPVKPFGVRDFKSPQLEEHAIGEARFETCAIRRPQAAGKGDTRGTLFRALRAKRQQLASQQIGESSRGAREELPGLRVQGGRFRSRQIEPGRLQLGVLLERMQRLVATDP